MNTAILHPRIAFEVTVLFMVAVVCIIFPDLLHAQTPVNSQTGGYICTIADNFLGNAGRGIATIGISVIGIGALLGKITWTQAMIVGVGVAVLFGAPTIITQLGALGSCT